MPDDKGAAEALNLSDSSVVTGMANLGLAHSYRTADSGLFTQRDRMAAGKD